MSFSNFVFFYIIRNININIENYNENKNFISLIFIDLWLGLISEVSTIPFGVC